MSPYWSFKLRFRHEFRIFIFGELERDFADFVRKFENSTLFCVSIERSGIWDFEKTRHIFSQNWGIFESKRTSSHLKINMISSHATISLLYALRKNQLFLWSQEIHILFCRVFISHSFASLE